MQAPAQHGLSMLGKLLCWCFKATFSLCLTHAPPWPTSQCSPHRDSWVASQQDLLGITRAAMCRIPRILSWVPWGRGRKKKQHPFALNQIFSESILKILSFVEPVSERWVNSSNLKWIYKKKKNNSMFLYPSTGIFICFLGLETRAVIHQRGKSPCEGGIHITHIWGSLHLPGRGMDYLIWLLISILAPTIH